MAEFDGYDLDQIILIGLVFARVAAVITMLPAIAAREVPIRFRFGFAILLTWFCVSLGNESTLPGRDVTSIIAAFSLEVIIGVSLGVVPSIVILGVRLASQMICRMTGLSLFDQGSRDLGASPVERLYVLTAIAIFLVVGGHRQIVESLLQSFAALPVGHSTSELAFAEWLSLVLQESFAFGVRFVAPIAVTLIASNLAVGFVSKALPAFNALTVGTSINLTIAFAFIFLSIGVLSFLVDQRLTDSFRFWITSFTATS